MKRILILCLVLLCLVPFVSATIGTFDSGTNFSLANEDSTPWFKNGNFTVTSTTALEICQKYGYTSVYTDYYSTFAVRGRSTGTWVKATNSSPNPAYPRDTPLNNLGADALTYDRIGYVAFCTFPGAVPHLYAYHPFYNSSSDMPPPIANFTAFPLSGAAPLYVMFDDTSTNETTGCTYNWTLTPSSGISAGATGTLENHAASFSVAGNYTVSHGVSCPAGSNTSTKTDYITVYNATTDYITTHFVVMDEPRWVQLAGSTINMLDIENGTWKNVSPSTTGYEGITTLSNHTISAFASMTGYGDDELLAQPAWGGGDYRLLLFPDNYGNVSAGNVTVYVSVYDSDVLANQGRVSAAAVNMAYSTGSDQVNDYRTTDDAGMVSFVVPNQTTIYLYAEKAGYTSGGTTINSGTGNGGSAAVYAEITLQRTKVTPAPTITPLPGGGTPAPTVDPYPCDADHPENCKRKQTEMGNTLIQWGPDLLLLFICATIIGTIKLMMK